jgi:3-hydroxyacyl-[acyl-carrier-protein] dehydratase
MLASAAANPYKSPNPERLTASLWVHGTVKKPLLGPMGYCAEMKFNLVDRIEVFEPGRRIVTVKNLSLAEEYLADHFPTFPVLPGVMMLEALTQSAAWLTRIQQNYARSVIVLAAAKNVRYASFVQPGNMLRCEVEAMEIGADSAKFKATGIVVDPRGPSERTAVTARIELRCFNLADRAAYLAEADKAIVEELKVRWRLVGGIEAMEKASA